jgi:aerobic-type carbon monoxide dehydrogenase small subunit (CoxS/CutS family)
MAYRLKITVNDRARTIAADRDTPLLYVLRNELQLTGAHFGCGLAQCGSCSVLLDGKEIRSCVTPVSAVAGRRITTYEGLPALFAQQRGLALVPRLHPIQQAWIDQRVSQCGYCQSGMMIKATELLQKVRRPTEAQIRSHMNGHLCRCGTYPRVVTAVQAAAKAMA